MTAAPNEETVARLRRAVTRLTPIQRQVFILSAVEGLAYAEIGQRLNMPVEAVERHLADALCQLDRELERAEPPWWQFW